MLLHASLHPFLLLSLQALAATVSGALAGPQPAEGFPGTTATALQAEAPRIQELLARSRHGRPRAEYRLDVATLP